MSVVHVNSPLHASIPNTSTIIDHQKHHPSEELVTLHEKSFDDKGTMAPQLGMENEKGSISLEIAPPPNLTSSDNININDTYSNIAEKQKLPQPTVHLKRKKVKERAPRQLRLLFKELTIPLVLHKQFKVCETVIDGSNVHLSDNGLEGTKSAYENSISFADNSDLRQILTSWLKEYNYQSFARFLISDYGFVRMIDLGFTEMATADKKTEIYNNFIKWNYTINTRNGKEKDLETTQTIRYFVKPQRVVQYNDLNIIKVSSKSTRVPLLLFPRAIESALEKYGDIVEKFFPIPELVLEVNKNKPPSLNNTTPYEGEEDNAAYFIVDIKDKLPPKSLKITSDNRVFHFHIVTFSK